MSTAHEIYVNTDHNDHEDPMKREVNTRDRTKARKNARGKVAIGFNLHLIG